MKLATLKTNYIRTLLGLGFIALLGYGGQSYAKLAYTSAVQGYFVPWLLAVAKKDLKESREVFSELDADDVEAEMESILESADSLETSADDSNDQAALPKDLNQKIYDAQVLARKLAVLHGSTEGIRRGTEDGSAEASRKAAESVLDAATRDVIQKSIEKTLASAKQRITRDPSIMSKLAPVTAVEAKWETAAREFENKGAQEGVIYANSLNPKEKGTNEALGKAEEITRRAAEAEAKGLGEERAIREKSNPDSIKTLKRSKHTDLRQVLFQEIAWESSPYYKPTRTFVEPEVAQAYTKAYREEFIRAAGQVYPEAKKQAIEVMVPSHLFWQKKTAKIDAAFLQDLQSVEAVWANLFWHKFKESFEKKYQEEYQQGLVDGAGEYYKAHYTKIRDQYEETFYQAKVRDLYTRPEIKNVEVFFVDEIQDQYFFPGEMVAIHLQAENFGIDLPEARGVELRMVTPSGGIILPRNPSTRVGFEARSRTLWNNVTAFKVAATVDPMANQTEEVTIEVLIDGKVVGSKKYAQQVRYPFTIYLKESPSIVRVGKKNTFCFQVKVPDDIDRALKYRWSGALNYSVTVADAQVKLKDSQGLSGVLTIDSLIKRSEPVAEACFLLVPSDAAFGEKLSVKIEFRFTSAGGDTLSVGDLSFTTQDSRYLWTKNKNAKGLVVTAVPNVVKEAMAAGYDVWDTEANAESLANQGNMFFSNNYQRVILGPGSYHYELHGMIHNFLDPNNHPTRENALLFIDDALQSAEGLPQYLLNMERAKCKSYEAGTPQTKVGFIQCNPFDKDNLLRIAKVGHAKKWSMEAVEIFQWEYLTVKEKVAQMIATNKGYSDAMSAEAVRTAQAQKHQYLESALLRELKIEMSNDEAVSGSNFSEKKKNSSLKLVQFVEALTPLSKVEQALFYSILDACNDKAGDVGGAFSRRDEDIRRILKPLFDMRGKSKK